MRFRVKHFLDSWLKRDKSGRSFGIISSLFPSSPPSPLLRLRREWRQGRSTILGARLNRRAPKSGQHGRNLRSIARFLCPEEPPHPAPSGQPTVTSKRHVPQPPAIAPTIRNGSLPSITSEGSGSSGDRWERSCSQAKKRIKGRRSLLVWSRIVPSSMG